jgi:hypothetical protein
MPSAFNSIAALHDSLLEAAETERRLPPAMRKQKLASWPEYKHEWLAYANEVTQVGLGKATARQITDYDAMLAAIMQISAVEDRRLLWAAAHSAAFRRRGPAWKKLAKLMHTNSRNVKAMYEKALVRLYYCLR